MQDNPKSTEQSNNKGHLLDRYSVQPKQEEDKSPFYKSAAPSISLPKGGGALKGIDEKFSVNAVNGTAGLEIALPLSPGRGGFTPALSLSYNSGSGNSAFGLGWDLSLPAIQRRTDKQLPLYDDDGESDVFLLAGAEDLVPYTYAEGELRPVYPAAYKIKRYRPRIEGLFARIEHIRRKDGPGSWWRVTTKDNITTYYGLDPEGRIHDPEYPGRVFKWLPQITLDHRGNVQWFRYKKENNQNIPDAVFERNRKTAGFAQQYLKRILYGNLQPWFTTTADTYEPGIPEETTFLMHAVFDYGDQTDIYDPLAYLPWPSRNDAFSDFHAGFEIRTYRKCRRVLMYHHFKELEDNTGTPRDLVRCLDLAYNNDGLDPLALREADYITQARQTGYTYKNGNWRSKSLPPMTFQYEALQWDTTLHTVSREDFRHAPQGLTGPYQWIDFEGEGISGILTEQGNGWFYKNNLGDGHFETARSIAPKPNFSGLGAGSLQWQDLDADGRRQVVSTDPVKGFWELEDYDPEDGAMPRWKPFRSFPKNANIDWESPFTKMLDLDGDGRAEVLITEDRAWTWFKNEGSQGFSNGGHAAIYTDEEKGPLLLLRDTIQSIFLADMNGDGLTDLVRIKNGEICYWPNMGYGHFGTKVTMANTPLFAGTDIYNPLYLSFADISGTGAADLLYTDGRSCKAWINMAGNGWGEAISLGPLPGTDPYSKIAVLDFLGNGTGCLVWSSPLPAHATAPIRYMDLMGGRKPYLMQNYRNGTGKEVSVTYKSSTRYYLEDKLAGRPWATRLPFPVHCISSVTTTDQVSGTEYRQLYRYRHGYYDHEEREFRGFGYVETTDSDKAISGPQTHLDQAPVLTKTWNHTGAWKREGTLLDAYQQEFFHFDGWDQLTDIITIEASDNAQEEREAYRALKGLPLRQEVYALDNTPQQDIPYSVTASAYSVKRIQKLEHNRYASFLSYQQQSVAFSCERNTSDPRLAHSFTLATDLYGNVTRSAQIAYARKTFPDGLPAKVRQAQEQTVITYSEQEFTGDAPASKLYYRLRQAFEAKSFEARLPAPQAALYTYNELKVLMSAESQDFTETLVTGKIRLLGHSISLFYNDLATAALPFRSLEARSQPYESYTQVLSSKMLNAMQPYAGKVQPAMLTEGGYVTPAGQTGHWLPSGKAIYQDADNRFYTPLVFTDPWNKSTTITYWTSGSDAYWLLPKSVTDALGNTSSVTTYDWRTLQPLVLKDLNDNVSEMAYDALGLPVAMAIRGKIVNGNSTEGDDLGGLDIDSAGDITLQQQFFNTATETAATGLLQNATWRCVYDFSKTPVAVGMIARQQHVRNPLVLSGQDTAPILRFSYSDALGRVIMHKVPCVPQPDGKNWIGSGRTIYNNKGNAVMQFEPYFSNTHTCEAAEVAATVGVSPKLYYDPLNRLYRTELPDGSFTKTTWTAWQQSVWDNNDTVMDSSWYTARIGNAMGDEEKDAAQKAAVQYDTPTLIHTDVLARPYYTIQHNRYPDQDGHPVDQLIHSYVQLDIQGNRLAVIDGNHATDDLVVNKAILGYSYNMIQGVIYQESRDSGRQWTLTDVAGQPLYAWDAYERLFRMTYDDLRRLTGKYEGARLFEKTVYGESYPSGDPKSLNLRGALYESYDTSGKQSLPQGYDFKGNPLQTAQRLLSDRILINVDWSGAGPGLSAEVFTATTLVDALNRPVRSTDPGNNIQEFIYDRGGALQQVKLNGSEYIKNIIYDAKGQRSSIQYGNNTVTKYTYDPVTYRLRRLLTTANTGTDKRQDLNYWYDPVGNITRVKDDVPETLFYNNNMVQPLQDFTYDALYRLVIATGREMVDTPVFTTADLWNSPAPAPLGSKAARSYTQKYSYDPVGNITKLQHLAGTGSYTRTYEYVPDTNRLKQTKISNGPTYIKYNHDARGNMILMPHLSIMAWNTLNELASIANSDMQTWYQYSGGQRIRKFVDKGNIFEERIYLGNFEIYRTFDSFSSLTPTLERSTVHISDDTGRIAMREVRNPNYGTDGSLPQLTRYIYSNHLQSATLELDQNAAIISYEEYHPYGTTAYQANSSLINVVAKRYRYTGKERDEESGLYYHGARYYIPWLARWTAVDPMESKYAGVSSYNYSFNNPVMWNDLNGADPREEKTLAEEQQIASGPSPHKGKNNVIITDVSNTNQELKDTISPNWRTVYSTDINKIYSQLEGIVKENGSIDNLVFVHHGSTYFGVSIQSSFFEKVGNEVNKDLEGIAVSDKSSVVKTSFNRLKENNKAYSDAIGNMEVFYNILSLIKPGGNYISFGCSECQQNPIAPEQLAKFAGGNINVYANTNPVNLVGGHEYGKYIFGSIMNKPASLNLDNEKGWILYDQATKTISPTYKDLVLKSEGTPFVLVNTVERKILREPKTADLIARYYSKSYRNYVSDTSGKAVLQRFISETKEFVKKLIGK